MRWPTTNDIQCEEEEQHNNCQYIATFLFIQVQCNHAKGEENPLLSTL